MSDLLFSSCVCVVCWLFFGLPGFPCPGQVIDYIRATLLHLLLILRHQRSARLPHRVPMPRVARRRSPRRRAPRWVHASTISALRGPPVASGQATTSAKFDFSTSSTISNIYAAKPHLGFEKSPLRVSPEGFSRRPTRWGNASVSVDAVIRTALDILLFTHIASCPHYRALCPVSHTCAQPPQRARTNRRLDQRFLCWAGTTKATCCQLPNHPLTTPGWVQKRGVDWIWKFVREATLIAAIDISPPRHPVLTTFRWRGVKPRFGRQSVPKGELQSHSHERARTNRLADFARSEWIRPSISMASSAAWTSVGFEGPLPTLNHGPNCAYVLPISLSIVLLVAGLIRACEMRRRNKLAHITNGNTVMWITPRRRGNAKRKSKGPQEEDNPQPNQIYRRRPNNVNDSHQDQPSHRRRGHSGRRQSANDTRPDPVKQKGGSNNERRKGNSNNSNYNDRDAPSNDKRRDSSNRQRRGGSQNDNRVHKILITTLLHVLKVTKQKTDDAPRLNVSTPKQTRTGDIVQHGFLADGLCPLSSSAKQDGSSQPHLQMIPSTCSGED